MIAKLHLFAAALAGVLVCSVAGAQMRSGTSPSTVQRAPRHARPAARASADSAGNASTAIPAGRQAGMIQFSPSGPIVPGFVPIENSFRLNSTSGVPGLGFDFPHLAAISAGLGNNPSHFGHHGRHGQGFFMPIWYGGYPYYYDDLGYEQPDQQAAQPSQPQPQIIVIQQPVPAQQSAGPESDAGNLPASVSESPAALPIPDVGNFILVRRDGRILFASAFSIVGAQLQYVTPEGIRRTLEMSDLDAEATQQMNEARGTTLQIHN